MKVISIWQPYASLIVHGFKFTETRGWPAPKSIIRTRIAIASTKVVRPEQRAVMKDPAFRKFYDEAGLPELDELPHGAVLGIVTLNSCDPITEEDLEDVTDEELTFGWWDTTRYAWRLRDPEAFDEPIPARGQQGIWEWNAHEVLSKDFRAADPQRPSDIRRHLYIA